MTKQEAYEEVLRIEDQIARLEADRYTLCQEHEIFGCNLCEGTAVPGKDYCQTCIDNGAEEG